MKQIKATLLYGMNKNTAVDTVEKLANQILAEFLGDK